MAGWLTDDGINNCWLDSAGSLPHSLPPSPTVGWAHFHCFFSRRPVTWEASHPRPSSSPPPFLRIADLHRHRISFSHFQSAEPTNHPNLCLPPMPMGCLSIPIFSILLLLADLSSAQQFTQSAAEAVAIPPANAPNEDGSEAAAEQQQQSPKCGTKETDFAPCLPRDRADQLFKHCCSQYVPEGCQPLCQYEADELIARNLLLQAVKTKKCDLKHFGTLLYCASQNQDNRKCCQHLNMADPKLGVGERCLRFCDPGGESGGSIDSIARADVTCLFNWNVLMYCHHSGIKLL